MKYKYDDGGAVPCRREYDVVNCQSRPIWDTGSGPGFWDYRSEPIGVCHICYRDTNNGLRTCFVCLEEMHQRTKEEREVCLNPLSEL